MTTLYLGAAMSGARGRGLDAEALPFSAPLPTQDEAIARRARTRRAIPPAARRFRSPGRFVPRNRRRLRCVGAALPITTRL